ncbi:MAG: polysaccharide pyruvyl transferase CsaB [Pseudanabaena sp.]|nr:MAG: polysaccharide pyruvyl transferase CsaB [Pseudanabaena sp.]
MRRAVLCGYYGMGNGGDEALLATLLQMLPQDIQPFVLSASPKNTEKLHGVEAGDRYSAFTLLNAFKRSDLFIWGGGSLMQDATSARNPIYYGGVMGLAQGMGLQTIAWAQGVGPLQRKLSKWISRRAFQGCTAISVRDRHSAELLANWQIKSMLAPDPVWALDSTPIDGDYPNYQLADPVVAVVLRSHPQLTSCRLATITEALQKLQALTNAHVWLVPFQPSSDKAIAQAIRDSLNAKMPKRSQIMTQADPRRLKGIFRHVDLAIAMRLHGVIMAAAEGCQCSAISYDPKVSYLIEDLGISGWELVDFPEDPQVLVDTWIQDLEKRRQGNQAIASRINQIKQQALLHQQLLTC